MQMLHMPKAQSSLHLPSNQHSRDAGEYLIGDVSPYIAACANTYLFRKVKAPIFQHFWHSLYLKWWNVWLPRIETPLANRNFSIILSSHVKIYKESDYYSLITWMHEVHARWWNLKSINLDNNKILDYLILGCSLISASTLRSSDYGFIALISEATTQCTLLDQEYLTLIYSVKVVDIPF